MSKKPEEWMKQAEYDMKAARTLYDGRTYIYAVFMCHLSIEKALKGLYLKRLNDLPPKTHNLNFLKEKSGLEMPEDLLEFLVILNHKSVPTRYPEDLHRMLKGQTKKQTGVLLENGARLLKWIKKQY